MDDPKMVQALALWAVCLTIAALAIWGATKQSRLERQNAKPQAPTPPWVWFFLILVVGLINYFLSRRKPEGVADSEPVSILSVVGILFLVGLLALAIVIDLKAYHQFDRVASRAWKRGKDGDSAGAIIELRAAIEADSIPKMATSVATSDLNSYAPSRDRRKGSPIRANTMGLLHCLGEEWAEGYEWFQKAEEMGGGVRRTFWEIRA